MSFRIQAEVTIKGGLPVLVEGTYYPPEPEVGIFGPTWEDLSWSWTKSNKPLPGKLVEEITESDMISAYEALDEASRNYFEKRMRNER